MKDKKIVGKIDLKDIEGRKSWSDVRRAKESSIMDLHRHRNILLDSLAGHPDNKKARLYFLEQLKVVDDEIILRFLVRP